MGVSGMTTTLERELQDVFQEALDDVTGARPVVTMGDDTALVSYRHPHQIVTDIWMRREQSWRLVASQVTPADV